MAAEYVANPAMVKELSEHITKHTISSSTRVALSSTPYTATSDGYMYISCGTAANNYEYGAVDGLNIISVSSQEGSGYMHGYLYNSIFVRKGASLSITGTGNGFFYPLA